MEYDVVVTPEAEADLDRHILYLLIEKCNEQAAKSVLDDFEITLNSLKRVAASLKYCENPKLKALGYRRINFHYHRYFMMYRICDGRVYVDSIFHELQDYESCMV